MRLTTVLFDLDGTLLPMDNDRFVEAYFGLLVRKMAPHGYDAKKLIDTVWKGTDAMIRNDGADTNEAVFWNVFAGAFGAASLQDKPLFEDFYREEFQQAKAACGYTPKAAETVRWLRGRGVRTVLATNPIFPPVATESRVRWAGLSPSDFERITTYDNTHFCKPNTTYFTELLQALGLQAQECLMVGNDTGDDLPAGRLGMRVFLLTDCLINRGGCDISRYPHGGFDELAACLQAELA